MNRNELRRRLEREGFDDRVYCLEDEPRSDTYCLHLDGAQWRVYFSQRGERIDERAFDTHGEGEAAACTLLYARLLQDPTTRRSVDRAISPSERAG